MNSLILTCLLVAGPGPEQSAAAPAPMTTSTSRAIIDARHIGARARVWTTPATGEPIVGVLRRVDDSVLSVETNGGGLHLVPLAEVHSLEIWTPSRRKTARWALIGAAVGGGGLALLGAGASDNDSERAYGASYGLIFGTVGGALAGGLGGALTRTGGWTAVTLPPAKAALSLSQGGERAPGPRPLVTTPGGQRETPSANVTLRVHPSFERGVGFVLSARW